MIDYDNTFETMVIDCENCNISGEFDGSWQDCIDEAKLEGWRFRKNGSDWEHYCSECKN